MTFKDLAKRIATCYNSLPALVDALRDGFNEVEGGGSSEHTYSTTEQKIGKWIDGKDLYERVVHLNSLPAQAFTATDYQHGIVGINEIVMWEGCVRNEAGNSFIMDHAWLSGSDVSATASASATVDKSIIKIVAGSDRSAWNADFIIKYTK